jgi:hypothetical protein
MGLYTDRGYNLDDAKNACGMEIENWYGSKVLDVFDSSVLGQPMRYYCSESDQLRMVNGKVSNTAVPLICGAVPLDPDSDPVYDWVTHTGTEAGKVHSDYMQFSKTVTAQYQAFKQQLTACTTVESVEALYAQLV